MSSHKPVMIDEVLDYLDPKAGNVYVDCTFGAGGYSKAILTKGKTTVYAIDCDPDVEIFVEKIKAESGNDNLHFIKGNFADLQSLLNAKGVDKVAGIVMDLGVSSMQLDQANRGFSFSKDAKLDMRMNKKGYSAHEFINEASEKEIADIIYKYGEERNSRRIAKNIVTERSKGAIDTTLQLADIVRAAFSKSRGKIDLATKTFQAVRIFINNELENLEQALLVSEKMLAAQGRLVVVSFHSLEDYIVKKFIKERSKRPVSQSRYSPLTNKTDDFIASFKNLANKAVKTSFKEIKLNPRARSARLRAAEKL
jgi:16S rRNA (cytosine1402-N4)-methyltransferase